MKSGRAPKSRAVPSREANITCGFRSIEWGGNTWARACDFEGKDLLNALSAYYECGPRCARNPGCTHFSWSRHDGGTCWLKAGGAVKADAFPSGDRDTLCGINSARTRGRH